MDRLINAVKAFWTTLKNNDAEHSSQPMAQAEKEPITNSKSSEKASPKALREQFESGALYTLTLLQREGRLVDFLLENIETYEDSQIGAAVRRIHQSCNKVIVENFAVKKIIDAPENEKFTVSKNIDREKIKLVGSVPDMFPFDGSVHHCGWESAKINLPEIRKESSARVIAPAEVGF
jgi:hypothetical protein